MEDGVEVVTETDAVAALARQGVVQPTILKSEGGREFLILPYQGGGANFEDITPEGAQLDAEPRWIDEAVTVQTTDSLVDYVERFALPETSLFADIERNRIVAVVDYHREGDPAATDVLAKLERPARRAHRATLDLPFSVEWKTWSEIDGVLMGQLEFARFLEENAADIEAPAAADLLETCRDLQAHRRVNFIKAVRTNSDNENFEYVDETVAGSRKNGGIEIPNRFELKIPIYFGGQTYTVGAFLRWRLVEGEGLKLGIRLHNPERIRQSVFKEIVMDAAGRTDRPAYFGRI